MKTTKVLLLSGSYRGKKTTTNAILDYVESKLSELNVIVFREQVPFTFSKHQFLLRINQLLLECDTCVLCFPLYFDSLPSPLISTLELLTNEHQIYIGRKMFTIVHCGLPEPNHCVNALEICKFIAKKMNFNYAGSAIIPDTGSIDGSAIDNCKRISSILDVLIMSMMNQDTVENELELIGKSSMNPIFFRIIGNLIMKLFARKNKANIFQKVYGL